MGAWSSGRQLLENGQKMRTTRVDLFDPRTNAWQAGPPLPEPRSDAASVSYSDALYVFGGGNSNRGAARRAGVSAWEVERLTRGSTPGAATLRRAVVCRGLLYIAGGMLKSGDYTTASSSLWVWNPASPAAGWKELPPQLGPGKVGYAMAEVEGRIYVFGGAKAGGQSVVNF